MMVIKGLYTETRYDLVVSTVSCYEYIWVVTQTIIKNRIWTKMCRGYEEASDRNGFGNFERVPDTFRLDVIFLLTFCKSTFKTYFLFWEILATE